MKPHKTIDRRFLSQVILLAALTVLPIIMISVNGTAAVRAILAEPESASDSAGAVSGDRGATPHAAGGAAPIRFGVFDPSGTFAADKELALRHIYISWSSFDPAELSHTLKELEQQGYDPLLTIEPWPGEGQTGELLPEILRGTYDRNINQIAAVLNDLEGPVYVSWGHEMDQTLVERYPWSGTDPQQFVKAYRYVVDRVRKQVDTDLRWVWAGVLKDGSLRYWPGQDYADYVGMPVYSFPSWDQKTYGFIRDFRTTFEEKKRVVTELNKPLMITELGVSGSTDFESFWLHQAFLALEDYPELAAVVFFYDKDTEGAWGSHVETPDWRVHADAVRGLVAWKLQHKRTL